MLRTFGITCFGSVAASGLAAALLIACAAVGPWRHALASAPSWPAIVRTMAAILLFVGAVGAEASPMGRQLVGYQATDLARLESRGRRVVLREGPGIVALLLTQIGVSLAILVLALALFVAPGRLSLPVIIDLSALPAANTPVLLENVGVRIVAILTSYVVNLVSGEDGSPEWFENGRVVRIATCWTAVATLAVALASGVGLPLTIWVTLLMIGSLFACDLSVAFALVALAAHVIVL